ncbi:exonuclease DPD1, chloroplastic/mitochondrial-like isoform X2 [Nymphaea colorata]|uniref:exonuclease DPD1, chloroplastic/mitochondrial-like isoform X2 n=1 Tax=Nymphaea colorata TaxID=210225 RepID=UPI00214F0B10|nr:exonuclease DPD1, chloroplastic/mitochondrial-like isoform X2 [Nymphaea colorata]
MAVLHLSPFSRCSMGVPSGWLFLETLPFACEVVKSEGSKVQFVSLASLCIHYDIQPAGTAHGAMSDVHTLSLVLQRMTYDLLLSISILLQRSFIAPA